MGNALVRTTTALLVAVAAVAIGQGSPAAGDPPAAVSSYYLGRGDPRACPSPICGGVWLHLVNKASTICMDGGVPRRECYVAEVDLTKLPVSGDTQARLAGLVAAGRALARGTL